VTAIKDDGLGHHGGQVEMPAPKNYRCNSYTPKPDQAG
jgi:hypothetical protein